LYQKSLFLQKKEAYRIYDKTGSPIFDVLTKVGGFKPDVGKKILCRHPFEETKRAWVTPSKVELLHKCYWDGKICQPLPSLDEVRQRVKEQVTSLRPDIVRSLNPTPYKTSVTEDLYQFLHNLWWNEAQVSEFD